ncbi:MAG: helix-turn-helix transcriptional regulator [Eubacteriales bacterium]|nr:helix-turn-helix transcriptional regulator [Eubacteriales bacterium]
MHVDYVEIGNRIREYRKMQKLTQEEAAEMCDITAAFYGNIERGDKKMSVETLMKVSTGLKVSADYLLFGNSAEKQDALAVHLRKLQSTVDESQMEKYMTVIEAVAGVMDQL